MRLSKSLIQDPNAGGTTALRGDPVWFNYTGMTPEQAAGQTSGTSGRAGNLLTSTPPDRNQYGLDRNNGSDMGGYSYHFQTGAIPSRTRNLGSSFATAFDLQYDDPSSNTVKELRFSHEIVSETFQADPLNRPPLCLRRVRGGHIFTVRACLPEPWRRQGCPPGMSHYGSMVKELFE